MVVLSGTGIASNSSNLRRESTIGISMMTCSVWLIVFVVHSHNWSCVTSSGSSGICVSDDSRLAIFASPFFQSAFVTMAWSLIWSYLLPIVRRAWYASSSYWFRSSSMSVFMRFSCACPANLFILACNSFMYLWFFSFMDPNEPRVATRSPDVLRSDTAWRSARRSTSMP